MCTIQSGPFKGLNVPEHEVRDLKHEGIPVLDDDGNPIKIWGIHHRTRHVLEYFPPTEGWSVQVHHEPGGFDIPDPNTPVRNDAGQYVSAIQPTVEFTARLVSPDGKAVAEATVLRVINGAAAWQTGQTVARGALYDAIGLSLPTMDVEEAIRQLEGQSDPKATPTVIPVASTSRQPSSTDATPTTASATEATDSATTTPAPSGSKGKHPETKGKGDAKSEPKAPEPNDSGNTHETPTPKAKTKAKASAKADVKGLNPNMVRQAKARAKLLGVELPAFNTPEELRTVYKALLQTKAGQKVVLGGDA